jgi:hypothetical protein
LHALRPVLRELVLPLSHIRYFKPSAIDHSDPHQNGGWLIHKANSAGWKSAEATVNLSGQPEKPERTALKERVRRQDSGARTP